MTNSRPIRAKATGNGPLTITVNGDANFSQFIQDNGQYLILIDDETNYIESPARWAMFFGTYHLASNTISVDLIINSSIGEKEFPTWINPTKNLRSRPLTVG